MKLLFVCHDPPSPADNGGSIDMLGMLRALHALGHEVDLVYTLRDAEDRHEAEAMAPYCRSQQAVRRNLGMRAAASFLPYQIASRAGLMRLPLFDHYDVAIVSDHCAGILLNPHLRASARVLRRQNAEAAYARAMAATASNKALQAFFLKEAVCFAYWHRHTDRWLDQIWYISGDELSAEARSPRPGTEHVTRLRVSSALLDDGLCVRPPVQHNRVLYFGSMTIAVNRAAVDWYVDHVLPVVRKARPDHNFLIAGRISAAEEQWAARHRASSNYHFVPNPENAEAIYSGGGVFVDPKAHSIGVKVKILEAVRHGLPVVCSPESLKGTGLKPGTHALVAADAELFAAHVISLLASTDRATAQATAARDYLRKNSNINEELTAAFEALMRRN